VIRAALVSLALCLANAAAAQEMTAPRIDAPAIDWSAAADAAPEGLAALNAAADRRFAGIAQSAVPVLLPFDAAAAEPAVLAGFTAKPFFQAGRAGYDAAFEIKPSEVPELSDIAYAEPIYVLLSGFRFTYVLDGPPLPTTAPVKALEPTFPGIRRVWHEFYSRTIFNRYGATYIASIFCRDVSPNRKILSCAQAARIADRLVQNLKLAGGSPDAEGPVSTVSVARPDHVSTEFTYYPPGSLIPGTGRRPDLNGRADRTVYADLRFPMRDAPAFANSQSFNNWGECDFTGRSPHRVRAKGAPYVCKVNGRALVFDEGAGENYRYPWRDNFCEHRRFKVGQCPAGEGHQGQDIRPSSCSKANDGADRCQADKQDTVAAADGMILRRTKQEALLLFINSANAHLRLRYMHMRPKAMDANGLLSGRRVREGEVLAAVGNYDDYEHGTTYHLHFDLQAPTAIGYVFVSPYMTLVASYERLIGARGTELVSEPPPTQEMVSQQILSVPLPPKRAATPQPPTKHRVAAPPPAQPKHRAVAVPLQATPEHRILAAEPPRRAKHHAQHRAPRKQSRRNVAKR
jgi:hypothetical protein